MSATNRGQVLFWVAVTCVFLSMILAIGGFATPGWYTGKIEILGVKTQKSFGLWACILVIGDHTTVAELKLNGEFAAFFESTRALSAIGTILVVIAFLAGFIYCCTKHKRITSAAVCLCITLGGILLIVAISIFAGYIHQYYDPDLSLQSNTYLDYSYYMQVVAGALALIAGCIFISAAVLSRSPHDLQNDW